MNLESRVVKLEASQGLKRPAYVIRMQPGETAATALAGTRGAVILAPAVYSSSAAWAQAWEGAHD